MILMYIGQARFVGAGQTDSGGGRKGISFSFFLFLFVLFFFRVLFRWLEGVLVGLGLWHAAAVCFVLFPPFLYFPSIFPFFFPFPFDVFCHLQYVL